ncbi:PREDICTED: uncharacterized protein LOC108764532, partial [Trachymyrmex cornetzi]|uniref:uncharacterized protein LOC108764532 n=1 Tax=Trachymyrmex cornetzi TaxID=471704 RepID=UPI00084EDF22
MDPNVEPWIYPLYYPYGNQGSPRNMLQHYQDAMAIVRKYGKPDLFITMTCNPNWREIRENLLPNPADRSDICAQFQKRGLPHIHLLVTLKQNYKILNPEAVDKFISAEIPNPDKNANLHNVVMKHMIHGPCGDWCLINNKCSKHFPKQFQSETIMDEDGYPQYCRRNDELFYERPGRYIVNNRYVVPYNPTLLLLFNSHINVEIVSSHDAASVIIGENIDKTIIHDEIRDFIEARYVGPVEACWRILRKPLQEKSHAIFRLPVHLPNEHSVIIDENINNDAIRSAVERMTMLLDYFELNTRDDEAKQYLY